MEDDQAKQYFGPPPTSITTTAISSSTGRHPVYKGIRCRSGKWVTEIREPRKTKRIWLGTYPTPEMAAAAYDAAALVLKGPDTPLNFPNQSYSSLLQLLPNSSPTAVQIRAVAANAAASRAVISDNMAGSSSPAHPHPYFGREEEYVDEEELLDMPNLLTDMAKGMLISPPRLIAKSPSSDDPVEENLWSFRF